MHREEVAVLICRLPSNECLDLPKYQSAEAVAMDLHAAVREPATLAPGDIILVPCGFSVAIPAGTTDGSATGGPGMAQGCVGGSAGFI